MDFNNLKDSLKKFLTESISYDAGASEEDIKKIKRNIILVLTGTILVFLLIFGIIFFSCRVGKPVDVGRGDNVVYVHVSKGMSSGDISKELVKKGVITSPTKFWFVTKLNGADSKFKIGTFALTQNMDVTEALSVLINGQTVAVRVTIPEGYGVRDIAKRLDEYGVCSEKEFLEAARDYAPYDYIEAHSGTFYRVEGFLFPDTYDFANDATAKDVMKRMVDEFDNKLTPQMRKDAAARNISIYELVNMASIIEKEACIEDDLPIVSQVLWKRLKVKMPLQSDATLQYVMPEIKEDVSIADTKIDSPYNSYQNYGLPPGPVASPGLKALKAALYPANTDYLYFVADRKGNNYFSNSYDEHMIKVNEVR
ncbi:MAG: endolytic transglycosylase MltG [Anaerovibrio sp.]|uniref:endolytic transglycosylase MltG n=1 Tax=Anaerovibrio sp. TaxID=1872532 RepID=UPI0025E592FE|nr:endolytic transglycosylase MltG [Anaerovibrio sp.]MCR5175857.1 endolytic transglycosylase MltG [Anaerovibrio sp.]